MLQRLFAPALPFAAEEAWSWWHEGSVHVARWPEAGTDGAGQGLALEAISEVLGNVRRAKTEAKLSQRAAVAALDVHGPVEWIAAIEASRDDLAEALTVTTLTVGEADDVVIDVALA